MSAILSSLLMMGCQTLISDPCPTLPTTGSTGAVSTSADKSHNAGQACLRCHDGTLAKSFDAGGTVVSGFFSADVAPAGTKVTNVGGVTLTVDQCGNFFAVSNPVTTTQPATTKGSMGRSIPHGNCNADGCHDGSTQSHIF